MRLKRLANMFDTKETKKALELLTNNYQQYLKYKDIAQDLDRYILSNIIKEEIYTNFKFKNIDKEKVDYIGVASYFYD